MTGLQFQGYHFHGRDIAQASPHDSPFSIIEDINATNDRSTVQAELHSRAAEEDFTEDEEAAEQLANSSSFGGSAVSDDAMDDESPEERAKLEALEARMRLFESVTPRRSDLSTTAQPSHSLSGNYQSVRLHDDIATPTRSERSSHAVISKRSPYTEDDVKSEQDQSFAGKTNMLFLTLRSLLLQNNF